ncbi:hypothetical protein CKF46_37480, partial [Klebsiella pneumoniae]
AGANAFFIQMCRFCLLVLALSRRYVPETRPRDAIAGLGWRKRLFYSNVPILPAGAGSEPPLCAGNPSARR